MSESPYAKSTPPQPGPRIGRILAVVLPIAALGFAAYLYAKSLETKARVDAAPAIMARMFTAEPMLSGIKFADSNKDMVADAPEDPAKLINPDVLVFSYVAGAEDEVPGDEAWTELVAALKEKTGKEVKIARYTTPGIHRRVPHRS